jgi:hypothetical protein
VYLPQSLDDVLAEARGYRLNLVLANQHLGQLSPPTREALAANARTRVVFQSGQEDAHYLAREFEPQLSRRDLQNLARFQVAIRLSVDGRTEPPFTGITAPPPLSLGTDHAQALAMKSVQRYGRPREYVEWAIAQRLGAEVVRDAGPEMSRPAG